MNPIDEQIAIKLFGWRWLAFDGVPECVHTAIDKTCRVRWLFPPDEELSDYWKEHLERKYAAPADGSEPLSGSPHRPQEPRFHDDETACFRVLIPAMEKRGWSRHCIKFSNSTEFEMGFYKGGFCYRGKADTMAEAICQAALRALEGENNG